jgi:amino acid transporter
LRIADVIGLVAGLMIGAGIFKAPAMVAANSASEAMLIGAWLLGGAISVIGALCYAELASAYPHTGGEYHFLQRAYGRHLAFLFAWSRLVVLQTGSIALLAFVLGDYATQLLPIPGAVPAHYAAVAVVSLTLLNIAGLRPMTRAQNLLVLLTLLGLVLVIVAGLASPSAVAASQPAAEAGAANGSAGAFGLAMVFVLLTYGGWNEAAYVSADLRDVRRDMVRALLFSIGLVAVIYVLINLAYLKALGIEGMSRSPVVTADTMRHALGAPGALVVTGLIVLAVLSSINVTILTGARSSFAMARDFPRLRFLGQWRNDAQAPANALIVQALIALLLIAVGSYGRSGFETLVQYVSPVFWLFFLMTTLSLFVLRRREPQTPRPFTVPGYPVTPLVFAAACLYMLYASLAYTGFGALLGVALLILGVPVLLFVHRRSAGVPPAKSTRRSV